MTENEAKFAEIDAALARETDPEEAARLDRLRTEYADRIWDEEHN